MIEIIAENADHQDGVRAVHRQAFGGDAESALVDRLRDEGQLIVSKVALLSGHVVGHVAISPVSVVRNRLCVQTAGLGPVAVIPDYQRQGIGGRLVDAGLHACAGRGWGVVFVLGEPEFYTRFGFSPADAHGLGWDQPAPPEFFLLKELYAGAAGGVTGAVSYHPAFAAV